MGLRPVFLVLNSGNTKIGPCAATYLPVAQTCPSSCPLKSNGCYAEQGHVGMHQRRLPTGIGPDSLAALEAEEIRSSARLVPRGWPLRLHVSGDATTPKRASLLADACRHWRGPVWAYTHAWRDVPRAAWGAVSVLASCESLAAAALALDAGYAPALVTAPHASPKAYNANGIRVIPCPNQTRGITCLDCRLCFDSRGLHDRRSAIAFEVHGPGKKRALTVVK